MSRIRTRRKVIYIFFFSKKIKWPQKLESYNICLFAKHTSTNCYMHEKSEQDIEFFSIEEKIIIYKQLLRLSRVN